MIWKRPAGCSDVIMLRVRGEGIIHFDQTDRGSKERFNAPYYTKFRSHGIAGS
jgi:hypothetical protein